MFMNKFVTCVNIPQEQELDENSGNPSLQMMVIRKDISGDNFATNLRSLCDDFRIFSITINKLWRLIFLVLIFVDKH